MFKQLLTVCVFTQLLLYSTQCKSPSTGPGKEVCKFKNSTCMTEGMRNFFGILLKGCEGLVPPIQPLIIENVQAEICGMKYELKNVKFPSLDDCVPDLRLIAGKEIYKYKLHCTKLQATADVKASGTLGPINIDASDLIYLTAENFVIKVTGGYGTFKAKDESSRFSLKEFKLDPNMEGKMTYKTDKNFGITEKEVGVKADNSKLLDKSLQYTIMNLFMTQIVKAGDIYLRATPMGDVFPKYGFSEDEKLKCLSRSNDE